MYIFCLKSKEPLIDDEQRLQHYLSKHLPFGFGIGVTAVGTKDTFNYKIIVTQ